MNSSSLSNAYNYIQGAAKLRLRLEPWITDQEFTSNGGIIYYAVDTDVIKVFLNPNKDISYASVFIDDDRSTQEILVLGISPIHLLPTRKRQISFDYSSAPTGNG